MRIKLICLLLTFPVFSTFAQELPTRSLVKGTASYYADLFHQCQTSNGEIFHMDSITAAHQSLKHNSFVKVTNLRSKKWVIVRINDRMPPESKHSIDLARGAYLQIGNLKKGFMPVTLEIVEHPTYTPVPTFGEWFKKQKRVFYPPKSTHQPK